MRTAHVIVDYKRGTIRVDAAGTEIHIPDSGEVGVTEYYKEGFDTIELTRILDGPNDKDSVAHDPPRKCGSVGQFHHNKE